LTAAITKPARVEPAGFFVGIVPAGGAAQFIENTL
jgi:hypothetical protein